MVILLSAVSFTWYLGQGFSLREFHSIIQSVFLPLFARQVSWEHVHFSFKSLERESDTKDLPKSYPHYILPSRSETSVETAEHSFASVDMELFRIMSKEQPTEVTSIYSVNFLVPMYHHMSCDWNGESQETSNIGFGMSCLVHPLNFGKLCIWIQIPWQVHLSVMDSSHSNTCRFGEGLCLNWPIVTSNLDLSPSPWPRFKMAILSH